MRSFRIRRDLAVEASRHRRQFRRLEGNFGRRFDAAESRGEGYDILRRRRLVVGDVVDAAGARSRQRRLDHGGDIGDMDAVEDLAGLDDASRRSRRQLRKLVAAGTVDSGQPENLHGDRVRRTEAEPVLLRRHPVLRALPAGAEWRRFIDPAAGMIAIDADGGEIADPAQVRRGSDPVGKGREHGIAGFSRRDRDQNGLARRDVVRDRFIQMIWRKHPRRDSRRRQPFGLGATADGRGHPRARNLQPPRGMQRRITQAEHQKLHGRTIVEARRPHHPACPPCKPPYGDKKR